ncbi:MAG: protein-glutamate methylesterase/protein-glutamine glutaminase [Bacillota bacterium]
MIKLMVVDDSAFMRKLFKESIEKDTELNVIETARNGKDALKKLKNIQPDVITLDIEMPVKDGITTLKEIHKSYPEIPVIMVSALDNRDTVMKALEIGAFDFIPKPSGSISLNIDNIIDELQEKIKVSINAENNQSKSISGPFKVKKSIKSKIKNKNYTNNNFPIIAIGASSGGPKALKDVLTLFPDDFPGSLVIVQHMPAGFTTSLSNRLNQQSNLHIREASQGDKLKPGQGLIAPGDYHMTINSKGEVELNQRPKKWGVRPCADYMLKSLAKNYKERIIGVILTGMGHDGGEGMTAIKNNGGYGIVEAKNTALVYGMPGTTIKAGAYDKILPRYEIPEYIIKLIDKEMN